ncbi:MAG: SLC13 family permease [Deltaproteobacteria bacterium]|nr:SLC13 family permease [Deltaproteobacteria bacterium]
MSEPRTPAAPLTTTTTTTASPLRSLFFPLLALVAALCTAVGVGGERGVVAGLFVAAAILWVSEAIHPAATALVVIAAAPLVGACTVKEAFAALGNPILFLFVGSFMIAEAMRIHGLGERLAAALTRRANTRLSALVVTSSTAFLLSMWISNSAATAVVLPIALALAKSDARFRSAQVLGVAWAASMGGLCTPVGTPPNLIGMRALEAQGTPVTFGGWMAIGLPIALVMLVAMVVLLAWRFGLRPGQRLTTDKSETTTSTSAVLGGPRGAGATADVDKIRTTTKPWARGEIAAMSAFLLAVVLWIVPGVLELFEVAWVKPLKARLSEEVVAVVAALLLFVWPIHRRGETPRRALSWDEAKHIDWGTVILFGGGILLGDLANKSGLAKVWGTALLDASGAHATWAVVALVTIVALVLSELASNTASATLVIPLAIGLAQAAGVDPRVAVMGATLGASFGFMMPISTAPNAMAYATGAVTVRQMASTGIVFDVVGYLIVVVGVLLLVS